MAGPFFKVVFEGRLVEGAEPAAVRAALGRLFKAEPSRIEAMFTGAPVVPLAGLTKLTVGAVVSTTTVPEVLDPVFVAPSVSVCTHR